MSFTLFDSHAYVTTNFAGMRCGVLFTCSMPWRNNIFDYNYYGIPPSQPTPVDSIATLCYCIAGNINGVQILFFSFSVHQNENLTHEMHIMMGVISCVKWTMKIKHMNQLEIAQNEIWTPRNVQTKDALVMLLGSEFHVEIVLGTYE